MPMERRIRRRWPCGLVDFDLDGLIEAGSATEIKTLDWNAMRASRPR
jgi:hypothetical protein